MPCWTCEAARNRTTMLVMLIMACCPRFRVTKLRKDHNNAMPDAVRSHQCA